MKSNYFLILILIVIILLGLTVGLSYLSTSTKKLSLDILSNRFINKNISEGFVGSCNKFNNGVSDPVYNSKHPNYCPDSLFYDGYIYRLYKNGDVIQAFNNYSDYVRYHNFMSVNYSTKGITCKPLTPINQGSFRPDSERDVFLNPSNVWPREYNIENFTNPPSDTSSKLNEKTTLFQNWFENSLKKATCQNNEELFNAFNEYVINQIESKIGEKIVEFNIINFSKNGFTPISKQIPIDEKLQIEIDIYKNLPECEELISKSPVLSSEFKSVVGQQKELIKTYLKNVMSTPECNGPADHTNTRRGYEGGWLSVAFEQKLLTYLISEFEKKIGDKVKEKSNIINFDFVLPNQLSPLNKNISHIERANTLLEIIRNIPICQDINKITVSEKINPIATISPSLSSSTTSSTVASSTPTTTPTEINSLSPSQRTELNTITEEYTKTLNDYFKTSMTNLKCSIQGDLYKGLSAYVIFQIEKKIGEKIKEVDFAQLGDQQFTPITKQIPIIDRANIILEIIRTLPACSDLVDFTQQTKTIGGLTSGPNTLLSKYTNQFVQKEVIAAQKPMCMNINELLSRLSSYVIFQIEKKINGRIKERSLLDLPSDNNFTILSINNSTVIPTYSLTNKQKIVEDILSTLPSCEIIMNFDYQTASAAATTQTISKSETLYTLEEARKKIEELYVEYLMKNKDCVEKIMDKTSEFSEKFKKSYELYLQEQLTASLGYLPMKSDLSKMTQKEIQVYIGILANIPNCNSLIAKYFPSTVSKPSTGIPVAIAPQGRSGAWNVSIVPPSDSKISISSQTLGGGMEIDAVVKENRGEVKVEPQGERKTTPPSAPYWNHLANIGKYLQDVALTNLIKNNTTTENTDLPDILRQKYLEEDRKMKEQIEKERLEDEKNIKELAKKTEEQYYATSPDIDWKDPKYHLKGTMADNFAFSPDYTNKHMEPDLKSAGAYGWSFVPPQFWSVPQKRPPVCIPSKGTEAKVVPVYDQSVPLDALEWSKVLPEVVYDRDYNPDYWAPGWKFQDQANYPNFTKSKNFSTEYYNYNRAMPTSK